MLKIKYRVIEKLNNLTRSEMKLALYIAKLSEEQSGCVEGLYYRDAMTACSFCKQSYYNALYGLLQKGAVTCEKKTDVDSDVVLLDNGFPWKGNATQTYSEGYISMASSVFQSPDFEKLKANEKYLLLEFMRRTFGKDHSYRRREEVFIKEWTKRLNVSRRTLRGYLHRLKQFFSIKIKGGMYHITRRHALFGKNPVAPSEAKVLSEQTVRCACNRLHVTYTPDDLKDTAGLIGQYRKIAGSVKDAASAVVRCIGDTVTGILHKDRRLDSRFVHRLLADLFGGKGKKDRKNPDTYAKPPNDNSCKKNREEAAVQQAEAIKTRGSGSGVSERITAADNGAQMQEYMEAGNQEANLQRSELPIFEPPDAYPDLLKSTEPIKPQGTGRRNRFHNFNERDYDYDKLEKWLLSTSPT